MADQTSLPLELSISSTTREPRQGESDQDHYFFISLEEFHKLREQDFFLEYAEVHGNYYGTSFEFVRSKLESGVNLILEIDVQGFRQINDLDLSYKSIFILPPSMQALEDRIKNRGDEDATAIELRLKNAKEELTFASEYQHIIKNDSFELAAKQLYAIIAQDDAYQDKNHEELQQFLAQLLSS